MYFKPLYALDISYVNRESFFQKLGVASLGVLCCVAPFLFLFCGLQ